MCLAAAAMVAVPAERADASAPCWLQVHLLASGTSVKSILGPAVAVDARKAHAVDGCRAATGMRLQNTGLVYAGQTETDGMQHRRCLVSSLPVQVKTH